MLNTKYRLLFHSFYDHMGIARYLEKMASKGWMLEKIGMLLKFRRSAPKSVHFAVSYFPDASQYDPHPSEKQLEMEEFCAAAGWKKVASSAQMQIFCNESADPVPLETDPMIQIDNIHAAMMKEYLKGQWIFIALAVWNLFLRFDQFSRFPTVYLTDNSALFNCLNWFLVIMICLCEILSYFHWHKKALIVAQEQNRLLPTKSRVWLQQGSLLLAISILVGVLYSAPPAARIVSVVVILYMLLVMAFARGIQALLKKWDFSAKANKWTTLIVTFIAAFVGLFIITFGIIQNLDTEEPAPENATTIEINGQECTLYHDILPLTLQDLIVVEDDTYLSAQLYTAESVLLRVIEGYHREVPRGKDAPWINYRVFETPGGVLYKYMENHLYNYWTTEGYSTLEEIDPAPWQAATAYRRHLNSEPTNLYVICWDNRIVEFSPFFGDDSLPQDLTGEQIAIITEKLSK